MYANLVVTVLNGSVRLSGECVVTDKYFELVVPYQNYQSWIDGGLAQEAFPMLNPAEIEFLISGMTPEGWDILYPPEDDWGSETVGAFLDAEIESVWAYITVNKGAVNENAHKDLVAKAEEIIGKLKNYPDDLVEAAIDRAIDRSLAFIQLGGAIDEESFALIVEDCAKSLLVDTGRTTGSMTIYLEEDD